MRLARVYQTEAIVLKRIKLGEADKILTLYSPTIGKFRAVAKGVRRPKSRLGGHVELLTRTSLLVAHGQNLDIVTQAQLVEPYLGLRDHLPAAGLAMYLAELVDQFTEERLANAPLYVLLAEALRRLAGVDVDVLDIGLRRPDLDDVFLTLTGHAAEDAQPSDDAAPATTVSAGAPR